MHQRGLWQREANARAIGPVPTVLPIDHLPEFVRAIGITLPCELCRQGRPSKRQTAQHAAANRILGTKKTRSGQHVTVADNRPR